MKSARISTSILHFPFSILHSNQFPSAKGPTRPPPLHQRRDELHQAAVDSPVVLERAQSLGVLRICAENIHTFCLSESAIAALSSVNVLRPEPSQEDLPVLQRGDPVKQLYHTRSFGSWLSEALRALAAAERGDVIEAPIVPRLARRPGCPAPSTRPFDRFFTIYI